MTGSHGIERKRSNDRVMSIESFVHYVHAIGCPQTQGIVEVRLPGLGLIAYQCLDCSTYNSLGVARRKENNYEKKQNT